MARQSSEPLRLRASRRLRDAQTSDPYRPWLNRFTWFTAIATLVLISIGGLVTSHGVGMAVPDWPTTYGYNMFLFPISKWVGGIFYEHSHRLVGSAVGLLTLILCAWLWISEKRSWVKWLGTLALFLVIVQGVLGGLRVTLLKDELGIFHGTLAQVFLLNIGMLAIVTTRQWFNSEWSSGQLVPQPLRQLLITAMLVIFAQLMLGATMRHQHSGLAVPDFPLAHGRIYPKTDAASLDTFNRRRIDSRDFKDVTAGQIHLHMAHRATALVIVGLIFAVWLKVRRAKLPPVFTKVANFLVFLVVLQFTLGAVTVLSNKAADIATAHVVCGALTLGAAFTLVLLSERLVWERNRPVTERRGFSKPEAASKIAIAT